MQKSVAPAAQPRSTTMTAALRRSGGACPDPVSIINYFYHDPCSTLRVNGNHYYFKCRFLLKGQFGSARRREESESAELGAYGGMDVVGRNHPNAAAVDVDDAQMEVDDCAGKYQYLTFRKIVVLNYF